MPRRKARLYAGTSGYAYPEWKGTFYPPDLPASRFLEHYASVFSTVEVNNTFYRFPSQNAIEGWRDSTPEGFRFAIKANQRITHRGRLKDVEDATRDFVERCRGLGDKLGPVLFQLPPYLRRDDQRLGDFLAILPPDARYAIEFRHESWLDPATFEALSGAGVALCVSEGEKLETPRLSTAGFAYLRLRKDEYTEADLRSWRDWIEGERAAARDIYVYLKHDEEGVSPEVALSLLSHGSQ